MFIKDIIIKDFRCLRDIRLEIHDAVIAVEGHNGSGKSSLLEALYYACHLRSFRTHHPKDLISFGQDAFFMHINFHGSDEIDHALQVGVSHAARIVRFDKNRIKSHADIIDSFRVVGITEYDMALIQGGPEERRLFLDHALMMHDPSLMMLFKRYRDIVSNRNSLLKHVRVDYDQYCVWTDELIATTDNIRKQRQAYIERLSTSVDAIMRAYFFGIHPILITYIPKKSPLLESMDDRRALFQDEVRMKRTLIGAHLDNVGIYFNNIDGRLFSSRGQQKMMVFIIKMAELQLIKEIHHSPLLLMDDFLTDFDAKTARMVLQCATSCKTQIFLTSTQSSMLPCIEKPIQYIHLS